MSFSMTNLTLNNIPHFSYEPCQSMQSFNIVDYLYLTKFNKYFIFLMNIPKLGINDYFINKNFKFEFEWKRFICRFIDFNKHKVILNDFVHFYTFCIFPSLHALLKLLILKFVLYKTSIQVASIYYIYIWIWFLFKQCIHVIRKSNWV